MEYISTAAQKHKTQVSKVLFKEEVMKKFLHWGLLIIGLGALLYIFLTVCGIIHTQIDIAVIVAFIPLYYALFFSLRDDIKGIRDDIKGLDKKIDKVADDAGKRIDKVADDVDKRIDKVADDAGERINKVADDVGTRIDKVADDVDEIKITLTRHDERLSRLENGE